MTDRQKFRIMKGIMGLAITYLTLWAGYGDVAPTWLLVASLVFSIIIGIVVYKIDPNIGDM